MLTNDNIDLMLSTKIDVRSFWSFLSFPYQTWDHGSKRSGIGNSRDLPSILTITFTV